MMRSDQRQRGSRTIKAQKGKTSKLLSLQSRVTFASVKLELSSPGN